jgi:hypothetical protein
MTVEPTVAGYRSSPNLSHLLVTKRRKGRADKARDGRPPQVYSLQYVEEANRAQHSQDGSLRRCSRGGVRNAG